MILGSAYSQEKSIVLVYLGRRGGGLQILKNVLEYLNNSGKDYKVVTSSHIDMDFLLSNVQPSNLVTFNFPNQTRNLLNARIFFQFFRETRRLIHITRQINRSTVIHLMPSPMDLVIDLFLPKSNKILRCIHDFQNHLGEKWPNRRAIKYRILLADEIICFSNFVAERIPGAKKPIHISHLPSDIYPDGPTSDLTLELLSRLKKSRKPICLCIGRAFEYKGFESLSILEEFKDYVNLLVVGTGPEMKKVPVFAEVIDHWVSDSDFKALIEESNLVLFPYKEASQSGVLQVCVAKGKIVVVACTGGLTEQIINYDRAFQFTAGDTNSFRDQLSQAILVSKSDLTPDGSRFQIKSLESDSTSRLGELIVQSHDEFWGNNKND
jgi:glycosyltransferase involved in cell wall biosynthesis